MLYYFNSYENSYSYGDSVRINVKLHEKSSMWTQLNNLMNCEQ
jgi:hypothetical protein